MSVLVLLVTVTKYRSHLEHCRITKISENRKDHLWFRLFDCVRLFVRQPLIPPMADQLSSWCSLSRKDSRSLEDGHTHSTEMHETKLKKEVSTVSDLLDDEHTSMTGGARFALDRFLAPFLTLSL